MTQDQSTPDARHVAAPYVDALADTGLTERQADVWMLRKYAGLSRDEAAAAIDRSKPTADRHWGNARANIADAEQLADITVQYNDPAGDPRDLTDGTYSHIPVRVATVAWTDDELLPVRKRRLDWFHEVDAEAIAVRLRESVEDSGQAITRETRETYSSFADAVRDEYIDRGDRPLAELAARWKAATDAKAALEDAAIDTERSVPPVTKVAVVDITLRDVFRIVRADILSKREAATAFATDDDEDMMDIMDLPAAGDPTDIERRPLAEGSIKEFIRVEFSFLALTTSITALFSMTSDPHIAHEGGDYLVDITYRLWRAGFERGIESEYPVRLPPNDALTIGASLATNYHFSPDAPANTQFKSALDALYKQLPPRHQHELTDILDSMDLEVPLHDRPDCDQEGGR